MDVKQFRLWTALITPMQDDGSIDYEDLETIGRKQEAAGNGILLLGSTGEGLALDREEKISVARFVSGLDLDVPLMIGVGGFNIRQQQEWIRECNSLSVDAYLLVAPLYSKPGPVGLDLWFRTLLDTTDKPCMLYNIPSRTGMKIPPSVIAGLNGHPNMWSLKEASGSLEEYSAFRAAVPDLPVYSGDDALLLDFVSAGCSGLVSVASNVWPEATSRYVDLCLAGEDSFAPIWQAAAKALFFVSNPIPSKVLLVEKGWIKSPALRLPLTATELIDMEILLEAERNISNWYKNEKD